MVNWRAAGLALLFSALVLGTFSIVVDNEGVAILSTLWFIAGLGAGGYGLFGEGGGQNVPSRRPRPESALAQVGQESEADASEEHEAPPIGPLEQERPREQAGPITISILDPASHVMVQNVAGGDEVEVRVGVPHHEPTSVRVEIRDMQDRPLTTAESHDFDEGEREFRLRLSIPRRSVNTQVKVFASVEVEDDAREGGEESGGGGE